MMFTSEHELVTLKTLTYKHWCAELQMFSSPRTFADTPSKYFPRGAVRTGLSFIPVNQASLLYFPSLISLV